MMGKALSNISVPVTKGSSGILIMPETESARGTVKNCIRCSKCVGVCPMGLSPYLLMLLGQKNIHDRAEKERIMDCIECGSCSYTCPANRRNTPWKFRPRYTFHLVQFDPSRLERPLVVVSDELVLHRRPTGHESGSPRANGILSPLRRRPLRQFGQHCASHELGRCGSWIQLLHRKRRVAWVGPHRLRLGW